MKKSNTQTNSFIELTDDDLKLIYNFPNLSKTFQSKEDLESIKQKLQNSYQEYERVIRQGSKTDAEKATKASQSIKTTLNLLDNIEAILLQENSEK